MVGSRKSFLGQASLPPAKSLKPVYHGDRESRRERKVAVAFSTPIGRLGDCEPAGVPVLGS